MGVLSNWRRARTAKGGGAHRPADPDPTDDLRPWVGTDGPAAPDHRERPRETPVDAQVEAELWERLREDPNDAEAFPRLAEMVRRRAAEGHWQPGAQSPDVVDVALVERERQRAADDAVWSLAEELAHSPRAWYPLIELARLSIHDDREAALRRLGTASDRDPSGRALAAAVVVLRDERMPGDAVNLGVGRWRAREHEIETGRQLVESAVEAGRLPEARRTLDALSVHPDRAGVDRLRRDLEPIIDRAQQAVPPGTPAGGMPLIDIRELREAQARRPFRRR